MKTKSIMTSVFILFAFTVVSQTREKLASFAQPNYKNFLVHQEKFNTPPLPFHFISTPTDPLYDSIHLYKIDALKKWSLTYRGMDIFYNSNKDILSLIYKKLEDHTWNNAQKEINIYDALYNKTNARILLWDGANWINSSQDILTYISDDKVETFMEQQWNKTKNSWENVGKTFYTYDANGNQLSEEMQPWDSNNNTWIPTLRILSSYTLDNKFKERFVQSYENQLWTDVFKMVFQYNVQGNVSTQIIQEIDEDKNWINLGKIEFVYDGNNNLSIEEEFEWNIENATWDKLSKYSDYIWDLNRKLLAYKIEDYIDGAYILSQKYKATYNSLSQLTDESFLEWDDTGTSIKKGDSTHFYIHEVPGSIKNTKATKNSIVIYPNPSNGTFSVATENKMPIKTLEVYNIIGELVLQQHLSNQVSIPNATSGIYFVKVDDGTGVYTRKIVIH